MFNRLVVLTCVIFLSVFSCASAYADKAKDQWENEILLQLSELRKTQGIMKKQIDVLTKALISLKTQRSIAHADLNLSKNNYPALGNKNADVAIVEFSDFECPFCRRHENNTLPELKKKYIDNGKVKYLFVDFPLGFHAHSVSAAVAGACAQNQGKFWQMHNLIFKDQRKLNKDLYLKLASSLHLNMNKFEQCLTDENVKDKIKNQIELGTSVGVRGTPSFLIGKIKNGKLTDVQPISGAQPFANFKRVLDKTLALK